MIGKAVNSVKGSNINVHIEFVVYNFLVLAYIPKSVQWAGNQIKSGELSILLWTSNHQNEIFLPFLRINVPIWLVCHMTDWRNSFASEGGKMATKEWPTKWTHKRNYTNHYKGKVKVGLEWKREKEKKI